MPLALGFVLFGTMSVSAGQYVVQPGDTLWGISRSHHLDLSRLIAANSIQDSNRIYPGQRLVLPGAAVAPNSKAAPAVTRSPAVHGAAAKAIIAAAAKERGVNPNLALALSYWESGWNQGVVSKTGAVGLMQIEPGTADWAGPRLLGRKANIHDARDNAELGSALLKKYLDEFNGDPKLALAAYYQGETGTLKDGIYPSSHSYVDGIWAIRNRFQAGGA